MVKALTVIVPSCNMEDYLPKCLGSLVVAPELMDALEVIVVNDGSSDRTGEIAHRFARTHPRTFRVIDKENGHYGSCINVALGTASGRYVRILDADDWYDTREFGGFLSAIAAETRSVDMFLTDYDLVSADGSVLSHGHAQRLVSRAERVAMHSATFRTQMLRDANYVQTEGVAYTDMEWVFYPVALAKSVKYLPFTVYKYRQGREGQSVAPAVAARSVDMKERVFSSMARLFAAKAPEVGEVGERYMKVCLRGLSNEIYMHYFFDVEFGCVRKGLAAFDGLVSGLAPFCLESADELRSPRRCGVRYVRAWHRAPFLLPSLLVSMRLYSSLARNAVPLWRHGLDFSRSTRYNTAKP